MTEPRLLTTIPYIDDQVNTMSSLLVWGHPLICRYGRYLIPSNHVLLLYEFRLVYLILLGMVHCICVCVCVLTYLEYIKLTLVHTKCHINDFLLSKYRIILYVEFMPLELLASETYLPYKSCPLHLPCSAY